MAPRTPSLTDEVSTRPGVRDYALLGGAALLIVTVLLVQEDAGLWALLPLLIGVAGLAGRWVAAPPLVLLLVLGLFLVQHGRWGRFAAERRGSGMGDVVLATALLVYVAAHMRLLTLLAHAVPPDRRRSRRNRPARLQGRWLQPEHLPRRSAVLVTGTEFIRLLLGAVAFAIVASLLRVRLALEVAPEWLRLGPTAWRLVVLTWSVTVFLLAVGAFLAYLRWTLAGADESLVYLQDQWWQATRGEGRRLWRWMTRARLRAGRKEPTT